MVQVALMTHPHVVLMCDPQLVTSGNKRDPFLKCGQHVDGFVRYIPSGKLR